jgi:hypothetical protein
MVTNILFESANEIYDSIYTGLGDAENSNSRWASMGRMIPAIQGPMKCERDWQRANGEFNFA